MGYIKYKINEIP